ncbi:hypothetical protein AC578_7537 [Pseudocercospora eumusae]|uniref:Glycosyltransferase 2-like domain-containing protein n=1 Tax=Pseudocercospora eumusae TaxID=321146 RepID=A0A139HRL4_9PEZI|nr:hypothetical protein AC578_7537 [Pseudocercospora eumusae]
MPSPTRTATADTIPSDRFSSAAPTPIKNMSNITAAFQMLAAFATVNIGIFSALAAKMSALDLSTAQKLWTALFVLVWMLRYARTLVGVFAYATYRPKPIAANPKYTADDATIIIPTTFKTPHDVIECIERCLTCKPDRIFVVTSRANVKLVKDCLRVNKILHKVKVLGVDKLNKREQMLRAIPKVRTPVMVFADDDVFWPDVSYLDRLLAIFENDQVGAGGTRQRVRRDEDPSFWNILGISYLERRVFNNVTTNAIDGSISTLSGRTSAYRSEILQTKEFAHYFRNDKWRGKPLNSDDDKCLTRYVYSHGWKICLQFDPKAVLETTVEGDRKYLAQCMRWARAHWRGNFTVMENETYWCSPTYWWGAYVIYFGQFWTPAIVVEALMASLLWMGLGGTELAKPAFTALAMWIAFTKNLKMIPHFCKYPQDMKFIPVLMAFSYIHGFMNVYAALSMEQTQWGSQNLAALETARAKKEAELVPLLQEAVIVQTPHMGERLEKVLHAPQDAIDPFEPTPAPLMDDDDFSDEDEDEDIMN